MSISIRTRIKEGKRLGAKRLIDVQHLFSASADVAEPEFYGLPELIRFRLRAVYRLHQNPISNITIRTHEKGIFHISKRVLKDSLLMQALSSLREFFINQLNWQRDT